MVVLKKELSVNWLGFYTDAAGVCQVEVGTNPAEAGHPVLVSSLAGEQGTLLFGSSAAGAVFLFAAFHRWRSI